MEISDPIQQVTTAHTADRMPTRDIDQFNADTFEVYWGDGFSVLLDLNDSGQGEASAQRPMIESKRLTGFQICGYLSTSTSSGSSE